MGSWTVIIGTDSLFHLTSLSYGLSCTADGKRSGETLCPHTCHGRGCVAFAGGVRNVRCRFAGLPVSERGNTVQELSGHLLCKHRSSLSSQNGPLSLCHRLLPPPVCCPRHGLVTPCTVLMHSGPGCPLLHV